MQRHTRYDHLHTDLGPSSYKVSVTVRMLLESKLAIAPMFGYAVGPWMIYNQRTSDEEKRDDSTIRTFYSLVTQAVSHKRFFLHLSIKATL